MKLLGVLSLGAVLAVSAFAQTAKVAPPPPTAPRPFEFPKHVTRVLPNGLTVFVIEDHRLPLVSYTLEVLAGGASQPPDKAGLASMAATLLREGTTTRTSKQISKLVDDAGGSLAASSDDDITSVTAGFMKSYADLGLDLLSDVVINPKFADDELARQRQQALSGLQVQYDDPEYIAPLAASRAILGTHPYAYPGDGTPETLRNLKREEIVAFHKRFFAPSNAYLAIAGDLTPDEAFAKVEKYFGQWSNPSSAAVKLPPLPRAAASILVIDKPNAVQTQLIVGHIGVPRNHPDYLALQVANQIFGGSFNSRLNMKLRANEGLTYGAGSSLEANRQGGLFLVSTSTRTEKTGDALKMILDLLKEWRANPATEQELKEAKAYLIGSFSVNLETAGAVAGRVLTTSLYGLPADYWTGYRDRVQALTLEQLRAIVEKHIQPGTMTITAVGNAKGFVPALAPYGTPRVIAGSDLDLIAPDMLRKKEAVVATPESTERARQLVDLAVKAHGGREPILAIKDMTSKGPMKLVSPQGEMSAETVEEVLYPGMYKLTIAMGPMKMIQATDGKTGWMAQGAQAQDMPPDMGKALLLDAYAAGGVGVLAAILAGQAEAIALPPAELNGKKCDVFAWKSGDNGMKILLDPDTHLISRISMRVPGMGAMEDNDTDLSDYRDVSGVKMPFVETVYQNGQRAGERKVTERKINVGLTAGAFKKP
jgi:zinc protease